MKKTIKKLAALLLAGALTAGMTAMPAFAADGNYTITIHQNEQDKGAHTYGAYQIFDGDLASDGTLSNIVWGSGITAAGKEALGDAAEYAKSMTEENAADKAAQLAQYLTDPEQTGSDSITGLKGGYYLVQDTTDPTGNSASKTKFILKVVKDATVNVKSSVPSVVKKVQDINDSDEVPELTNLQDSADYDIGDTVPYTITGTIGSGIANYEAYSFNFVDSMSKGLTLDQNSWDIKVGGESIKDLFTLTNKAGDNGATVWTWAATDIKQSGKISDGTNVVLTYNCVLNQDAVVGATGNPNTVHLEFDNNPNESGKGKPGGKTPDDTNIVFTYKTIFNKTDGEKPLAGADFTLEKKVGGEWVDVTTLGTESAHPTKSTVNANTTEFEFSGLDDGDYRLREIQTPEGYNTIDPIEFTITAEHDITSESPTLTKLTGTDGKGFTMTPVVADGSLTANVVNEQGSTLPSTGGMGTTIFYVIGGILVLAAVIVLISKRRVQQ